MKFSTRSVVCSTTYFFLHAALDVAANPIDSESMGTGVGTATSRRSWWNSLLLGEKQSLKSLFDRSLFDSQIDFNTQIAYLFTAQQLYDFLESEADSDGTDSYIGFAPTFLRANFHSAGTYDHVTGAGGSNGGTCFNPFELEDMGNGCMAIASDELFSLFHGNSLVTLADVVVLAGVIALDVMNFPCMDLVRFTGGRMTVKNMAYRELLPSSGDDPMTLFQERYNLTLSQTVALAGGAHNFGAAHSKCSGYIGQWTSTPLDWSGPDSGPPSFFSDLLKEDWRWYRVCTFENNTVSYKSIPDRTGDVLLEDKARSAQCALWRSRRPILCREQAMRGCDFRDGTYSNAEFPCNADLLQMRLPADFFLKTNPELLPHSTLFAENATLLAEEFGLAFQKITHLGLKRCGLGGHGCPAGHSCKIVGNNPHTAVCRKRGRR